MISGKQRHLNLILQAGAEFSFDFLLLLVLAGAIAFMGLVENSSVVLVASMLVSPLMGPILAGNISQAQFKLYIFVLSSYSKPIFLSKGRWGWREG